LDNYNYIPVVWQISALYLDKKILISGVILRDTPFAYEKQIGNFRNLLEVCKSYFVGVYGNKEILITTNNKTINTNTDKYGSFSVVVDFLYISELIIKTTDNDKPLQILQTYPIIFENTKSIFDVISDIDDTIIVSYTADFLKRIGSLAFTLPKKRKAVGFTQKLFKEFEKQDTRVFYVSKSESNLFAMLTSFIKYNKLPTGILILTPYLKFSQLFNPKKGRDYKLNNIWFILKNTGAKKYVLFGDDSQKDMEVYSEIAQEFPERILKIYIRQTKRKVLPYQKRMWKKLELTEIPIVYFNDNTTIDFQNEFKLLTKTSL
jgi:phosphatidate phosphatase APP1